MSAIVLLAVGVAWFKEKAPPLPPSPPPPSIDVLSVLVAMLLVLLIALNFRRGGSAAAPTTASSTALPTASKAVHNYPRGPLLISWGSQTGTAEQFGNDLAREARQRGYDARSVDLEELVPEELASQIAPVVFLMSTHGEGEPTDNAIPFYTWANDTIRDAQELASLRFAVFALGNTQYEHFCFMGKWAHRRLLELGATPVHELGLGNDDQDLQADFEAWREGLWPALSAAIKGGTEGAAEGSEAAVAFEASQVKSSQVKSRSEAAVAFEASFRCRWLPGAVAAPTLPSSSFEWLCRAFPKQTLYECRVEANLELTNPELTNLKGGSVRHIELACNCTERGRAAGQLRYAAADDLGVCCDNGHALAERTARALGLSLTASFEMLATARGAGMAPPLPSPCTLEHALRYYADVRAPAPKPLLKLLAAHTVDAAHARRLEHLASAAGKEEYTRRIIVEGRGLLELLEENPSCRPPLGAVLELVPKLSPRYYTISSSPIPSKGARVAMTVKVLREPRQSAETRLKEGVCSTQLGALALGQRVVVFVRASAFRLPRDPATPVLMVGPGTGIAPFRAFVQELSEARRTGETRLYFGCRHAAIDFLYADELRAAECAGTLTKLRTAFSRDGPTKVYVQQRLREDGALVYGLLEQGAHVYLCGGTGMGREVVSVLAEILGTHGKLTHAQASEYLKRMTSQGRLVQELWS